MAHIRANAACDNVNNMRKRTPEQICSQAIGTLHLDKEAQRFKRIMGSTVINGKTVNTVIYAPTVDDTHENESAPS